jgi:hypothetical protein
MKLHVAGILSVGLAIGSALLPAQTPIFQGLGQMPALQLARARTAAPYPRRLHDHGLRLVCANGQSKCSSTDTVQAYRWTAAGGYQILGTPGNSDFFGSGAIS